MSLIDFDTAFDFIDKAYGGNVLGLKGVMAQIPIVDPVKHGYWTIKEDQYGRKFGVCSECGNKDNVATAVLGHYCWFCGTKMDKEVQN